MNTCVLFFSSHKNGNCASIVEYLESLLPDPQVFLFSSFSLTPCGHCDYECLRTGQTCPHLDDGEASLINAVTASDMAYFVVPNYSDYPCANFFIYNERSLGRFMDHPQLMEAYQKVPKRFLVVSCSELGNFTAAFAQHTKSQPDILCLDGHAYGTSNTNGQLLTSQDAREAIREFIKQ